MNHFILFIEVSKQLGSQTQEEKISKVSEDAQMLLEIEKVRDNCFIIVLKICLVCIKVQKLVFDANQANFEGKSETIIQYLYPKLFMKLKLVLLAIICFHLLHHCSVLARVFILPLRYLQ